MTFGERLRWHRKKKKFTQEQLAQKIGVAKTTITGYEKNNREPDVLKLKKIAEALEVSVDELIGMSDGYLGSMEYDFNSDGLTTPQNEKPDNQHSFPNDEMHDPPKMTHKEKPPPKSREAMDREVIEILMRLPKEKREDAIRILEALAGK